MNGSKIFVARHNILLACTEIVWEADYHVLKLN